MPLINNAYKLAELIKLEEILASDVKIGDIVIAQKQVSNVTEINKITYGSLTFLEFGRATMFDGCYQSISVPPDSKVKIMPRMIIQITQYQKTNKAKEPHLGCCPQCGSGDMHFCSISVRPYCNDCHWWAPVNHGSKDEALAKLRDMQIDAEVEATNMI